MRRAGGWILGVTMVAAMAAGAGMAFRPILKRETFTIHVIPGSSSPTTDALLSGMTFAMEQAGGRAGGFLLRLHPEENSLYRRFYSPLTVDLGSSDLATATVLVQDPTTLVIEKRAVLRVHPGLQELGRAAASWAREKRPGRITLLHYQELGVSTSEFKDEFFDSFSSAAGGLPVTIVERPLLRELEEVVVKERLGVKPDTDFQESYIKRVLAGTPDLVLYAGEKAPYGQAFEFFEGLRKAGYRGLLAMTDSDPEVSYLAVPAKTIEGTFLLSTIGPPGKDFAAAYEPATGRHAGPHAWPGYLLMKAVIDLIDRAGSTDEAQLQSTIMAHPPALRPCALYQFKAGKFVYLEDLK